MALDIAISRDTGLDIEPEEILVKVEGDLAGVSGRDVRRRLSALVTDEAAKKIALDLSGVKHLDSSGLAALIGILRLVREQGGDVRVVAANAPVRRVFEITALARVFKYRPAQMASAPAA